VAQYFPEGMVDGALAVMKCESLGDPLAYNAASGASGLYQFIPGTWAWASPSAGFSGSSPFDAEANIATAAWLVQRSIDQGDTPWAHWSCTP
jgi:soluble lytic murein transglycosylase-like protein